MCKVRNIVSANYTHLGLYPGKPPSTLYRLIKTEYTTNDKDKCDCKMYRKSLNIKLDFLGVRI